MSDGTREKPILFSAPMVRAILDGRKTQTRRIVKPIYEGDVVDIPEWRFQNGNWFGLDGYNQVAHCACPYGQPGDQLWVRETWSRAKLFASNELFYRADGEHQAGRQLSLSYHEREKRWRSPIHMPRWASRITLEITGVRVERLQEISEADAIAEGTPCFVCGGAMDGRSESDCHCFHHKAQPSDYRNLWESINGPGSWDLNPYVWVIEFKRV